MAELSQHEVLTDQVGHPVKCLNFAMCTANQEGPIVQGTLSPSCDITDTGTCRLCTPSLPPSLFAVPTVSTICTNGLASTAGRHLHRAQLRKGLGQGHTPEVHCAHLYTLLLPFHEANPI